MLDITGISYIIVEYRYIHRGMPVLNCSGGTDMPNSFASKIARLKEGKVTKSQRKLIDYFASVDQKQVIYMSITDLAAATGVAEATVLRFCRSLGFNGYQEFRLSLAQGLVEADCREHDGISYVEEIAEAYSDAVENCRRTLSEEDLRLAYDMIFSARAICCFGVGHSHLAALELHNRLMMMGMLTYCERDAHLQNVLLSSRNEEDLLILFSISGSTKDAIEAAEIARACGMKVMIVTCYENSPVTRYADLVISAAPLQSPTEVGSMRGKIMQLFLVDVICTGIHLTDKPRFDLFVAKSNRATVSKLV